MRKIVLLLLTVLAACGQSVEQNRDLLRVGIKSEPVTLFPYGSNDAATSNLTGQIFESLITKDVDGKLTPELALSWTFTNPTNLVLSLRTNVFFHNGEKFTAEDVKFSIDTMIATPTIKHIVGTITGSEVIDEYTIQINLSKPFVPILAHLTHPAMVIMNKKATTEAGEQIDTTPVGTGPYQLKEWNRGRNVVLTRNENYWNEKAKIANLDFIVIPENSTRAIALESGEIDFAVGISAVDRERIAGNPNLKLIERILPSIEYFGFNQKEDGNPIWKDRRVREAVALAIDVPGIINSVYFGAANPSSSLTHSSMIGYYGGIPQRTQDIQRAKALIKEAGVEGAKVVMWTIEGDRQKTLEIIQANLKEIGLEAEIQVYEWARFLDGIGKGEHDTLILGWSDGTGDVDYTIYNMMNTATRGVGGNRSFYSNPALDVILEAARSEYDPEKRLDLYRQAQEIIYNEVAIVPLFHKFASVATANNVAGFQHMSTDDPIFATVYFTN